MCKRCNLIEVCIHIPRYVEARNSAARDRSKRYCTTTESRRDATRRGAAAAAAGSSFIIYLLQLLIKKNS